MTTPLTLLGQGFTVTGSNVLRRLSERVWRETKRLRKRRVLATPIERFDRIDGANWLCVEDACSLQLKRPENFSRRDWQGFRYQTKEDIPAGLAMELTHGFVLGRYSWTFTRAGTAVSGLWEQQGADTFKQHLMDLGPVTQERLARAERLSGTTLVLNQVWGGNYYHWTNQIVPRLHLAKALTEIERIDHVITPQKPVPFMAEWLGHVGIDPAKMRPMTADGFACERLIATSNPGPHLVAPDWANGYLRRSIPEVTSDGPRRIFLTREDAPSRRLLNGAAVSQVIKRFGFEPISMSGRSVAEQASLCRNAEIIVGVHGAALTNLVFCAPGTAVVELMPKNHLYPSYWSLGQSLDLRYRIVLGREAPLPIPLLRQDVRADLSIDPAELEAVISTLLQG